MRSARIVSSVIRMTLGSRGAGGRGAAAPAIALATEQRTHSKPRVRNIGYKKSIIGGFVASMDRVIVGRWRDGRPARPAETHPALPIPRYCGFADADASPWSRFSNSRAFGENCESGKALR